MCALHLTGTPDQFAASGSNPGWQPGYVPPATEWNDWWSRKLDADDPAVSGAPFVSLAGGTMTGELLLPTAFPTDAAQAVTKGYVDSLTFASGPFMPQTGGTFTGPITLPGNPAQPLQAAPKQYVDAVGSTAGNALTVANAAVRRTGDTMTGVLTLVGDPSTPLGAATAQYVYNNFLRITGGTITGSLGVNVDIFANRDLYVNSRLFVNSFNGNEWYFTVDGSGNHLQNHRSGWYDYWASSGGARHWVGNSVELMNLDGTGVLNVKGAVNGGSLFSANRLDVNGSAGISGNASVAGTQYAGAFALGPFVIYNDGNQIQSHTAGWYEQWRTSDGNRLWVNGNIAAMQLDPSGNFWVNGSISAAGQIYSASNISCAGSTGCLNGAMWYGSGGSGRVFVFDNAGVNYFDHNPGNGDLWWNGGGGPGFWAWRVGDHFAFNNRGPVGGVGGYQNISDERAKTDIQPLTYGLQDILKLDPIAFARVQYDGRKDAGFSAQQVQRVIPEAVRPMGILLPDGSGGIDTDDPSLGVSIDPIVAALVNGMKELAAEIVALKAAR